MQCTKCPNEVRKYDLRCQRRYKRLYPLLCKKCQKKISIEKENKRKKEQRRLETRQCLMCKAILHRIKKKISWAFPKLCPDCVKKKKIIKVKQTRRLKLCPSCGKNNMRPLPVKDRIDGDFPKKCKLCFKLGPNWFSLREDRKKYKASEHVKKIFNAEKTFLKSFNCKFKRLCIACYETGKVTYIDIKSNPRLCALCQTKNKEVSNG